MSKLIELEKISFIYKKNSKSEPTSNFLISDTSLQIDSGDFISIIGKNGSGKSTLVKLISKILVGYNGSIFFKGKEIHSIDRKEFSRSLSYLPQTSTSVNDDLSVTEFLLLGRYSHKAFSDFRNSEEDREIVELCMKETGIEKFNDKYLFELSGGERQKVLLTLGLVQLDISKDLKEKVLIIDEPLTYLDVKYQLEIFNVLKSLNQKGLTVVIVIHDLGLALNYTNKTILMNSGKMVKYSESGNVITEEVLKEHFLIDSEIINHGNNFLINYTLQNRQTL